MNKTLENINDFGNTIFIEMLISGPEWQIKQWEDFFGFKIDRDELAKFRNGDIALDEFIIHLHNLPPS